MPKELSVQTSRQVFYSFAIALFVYGWLSVNIYLPVLPKLESVFDTTTASARLTVTIFLFGFSFAQLIWGPLSDRVGRKPVLLAGLAISMIGALIAAFATDIYVFSASRLLESLGLGAAPVLARSVLTDTQDRAHVAIAMAYAALVVATVPAVAPIFGGYLNLLLSWRGIFFFIAVYGAILLVLCVFRLPETDTHKNLSLKASHVVSEYLEMLCNGRYAGYISVYGITFGTLVGYYAAAPFIFVSDLGYNAHEYGYLLIFNIAFYVIGATASRLAVPKLGTDLPIVVALAACALASVIFLILDCYTTMDTVSVLLPMSVYIFGAGLVSPAANAGAMTIFKDKAGAATAIVGFAIAMGGAIFSGGLSAIHITRLTELAAYVGISTLIFLAVYMVLLRQGDPPQRLRMPRSKSGPA